MTGRFDHFGARVPASPTDWSWRTLTRRPRGKSAVDSDVVDAMEGHPVDARSRVRSIRHTSTVVYGSCRQYDAP